MATSDDSITKTRYGETFEVEAGGGTWHHHNFAQFLLKLANLSVVQNMGNFPDPIGSQEPKIVVLQTWRTFRIELQVKSSDRIPNKEFTNYVVLQARTDSLEKAHKFYRNIGFEECGFFDQDSELSKNVFPNFPDVINVGETSKNDFIHFIGDIKNNPDLAVFKNTTGLFIKEGGAQR